MTKDDRWAERVNTLKHPETPHFPCVLVQLYLGFWSCFIGRDGKSSDGQAKGFPYLLTINFP